MGIYYKRSDVVSNPSDAIFTDDYTIYYGGIVSGWLNLKSYCIQRYVFQYINNLFTFHHRSIGVRHYNNSAIIDVDTLNQHNNIYVEPQYDLSYGQKSNIPPYPGIVGQQKPVEEVVNILTNTTMYKLINSPTNGEFYFIEALIRRWQKALPRMGYEIPVDNFKAKYVFKIYRYGVCNVENIVLPSGQLRKQQFTYKIVKTINRNSINDNQLKST